MSNIAICLRVVGVSSVSYTTNSLPVACTSGQGMTVDATNGNVFMACYANSGSYIAYSVGIQMQLPYCAAEQMPRLFSFDRSWCNVIQVVRSTRTLSCRLHCLPAL